MFFICVLKNFTSQIKRILTTVSFIRFPNSKILYALSQMQLGHRALSKVDGMVKYKLMGSGAGNGFSIWPDWNVYCLLIIWENEEAANRFFDQNPFWKKYTKKSKNHFTLYISPVKTVGLWDGENPFQSRLVASKKEQIVVLTRATIKKKFIPYFWSKVPKASKEVPNMPGHIFSKGVGELPLFLQATVSVWDSKDAMMDYAYRHSDHLEMIKMTKEKGWYSEEMFTEFNLIKTEGKIF